MKLNQLLKSHPALCRFVAVRYVAAVCSLSGCVPATAYEQANSTADVEREGHRRAAEELVRVEGELKQARIERDRLLAERSQLLSRLQNEETRSAQASLDVQTGEKATEQQQELVTQLRGELARVGQHIKVYEGERSDLRTELEATTAALAEKNQRISSLQAEVAGLKTNEQQSEVARDQLSGALDELANLQDQIGEVQEDRTQEEREPQERDQEADPKVAPEEVLPSEGTEDLTDQN